jgi:hypothetical protein
VTTGPAVSKSAMGNLEVNVFPPEGMNADTARMYVDDAFVGNVSGRLPVLCLKRGKRRIRIELDGAQTYQETIDILGEPNHQVLNVMLQRK